MKIPYEKEKHKRGTGRGLHRLLCLVLVFAILTGSFPANTLTVSADEPQQDDVVTEQDATQSQEEKGTEGETQKPEKEPESKPETVKPEKEKQEDKKNTNGKAEDEGKSKAELKEKAKEKPKKEPKAAEPRETTDANSISGMLWLDVLEDKNSGVLPGDGIRQEGEQPLAAYEVSLYKAEDKTTAVETVQTDSEGKYIFEHLEPGSYVVGISTCIKGDTEYLLPVAGITDDNQFTFAAEDEEYTTVYSEELAVEADTVMTEVNAGMRIPPGIMAASLSPVGIQPSKSDLYVRNQTKIGFGGKQWWVIGDSSTSTPASLRSPSAGTVTLFSDRSANFGTSPFNNSRFNNNYNNSSLQTAMTNAYNNNSILTPKERTYVVPRSSMDLQSYPTQNAYNYANPTNQNFWPLSAYEYNDINDMPSGAYVDVTGLRGDATSVWLRSPYSNISSTGEPGVVVGEPAGSRVSNSYYENYPYSVRPAFYFDLSSALFLSLAGGGGSDNRKSVVTAGTKKLIGATTPNPNYNNALKLTMEDDTSNGGRLGMTVASLADINSHPTGDVSFSYSGASTGPSRSVSVMICNKDDAATNAGKILFYGRPVDCTSGNASGTATFTLPNKSDLPVGDYTLKIFNEEVNGDNYTDYASTPIAVGLHVRDVEVSLSANPDDSKVYYTDTTPGHVDLTATVENYLNIPGITIQDVQWFRVPIIVTTDYDALNAFDSVYAGTVSANKGTIGASSNNNLTATFPLRVDENARYWFKGTVYDPATSLTYTHVSSIAVDNLYKEITCTVSGINNGVSPADTLYADETIPGQYGIPYDLSGSTPVRAPSQGFDTITLSAKTQYIPYGTVTTKSGHALTTSNNAKVVTLDGNTNAECDSGDFTKYTISYSIKRYVVTRDNNGAVLGSHDQLADAVNSCLSGVGCTITAFADDSSMGIVVPIQNGKQITLTSIDPGSPRTITQTVDSPNGRHFLLMDSAATLILKDITLKGKDLNSSADVNGGVEVVEGYFVMQSSATIKECAAVDGYGGGVELSGTGIFVMAGDATISDNNAGTSGGGVRMKDDADFTMRGGTITRNNAGTDGGGIWAGGDSWVNVSGDGTITGNMAARAGGGIFLLASSNVFAGGGEISGNTAGTDGGGIYTEDYSYDNPADTDKYSNLMIFNPARVEHNTATNGTEVPPSNAADFDALFPGTLLNNNNINYRNPNVDVTISKTVAGDYGDRNKKFDFTITVQDTSGTPLASGTSLSYTGGTLPGSGAEALEDGTLTLDATGSADFKLKHGQTVTVSGIPTNGKVQIAETAVSGYSTTYQIDSGTAQNGTDTNLIAMNGTNRTAAFVNTHGEVVAAGITGGMTSTTLRITTAVLSLAGAWYLISRRARRKRQKES